MVDESIVSVPGTQADFTVAPQYTCPFDVDSYSFLNLGDDGDAPLTDVEIAFDAPNKCMLTLRASGPGQAFTVKTRSQKIWLRVKNGDDAMVQINAVKER